MTVCIYQSELSQTHFGCSNTDDLIHDGTVPKDFCNACLYAQQSRGDFFAQTKRVSARKRSTTKPKPCGGCKDNPTGPPAPPLSREANGQWFVAVTTAPRKIPTLQACVASLRRAGWEPTVFAEPDSPETDCLTIANPDRLGVWNNWLAACRYALEQTAADLILTVQDDSIFHPDSRTFTESALWPSKRCGFLSLYTPRHYSRIRGQMRPTGIRRVKTRALWGACALVWHRDVLQQVIEHRVAQNWLGAMPKSKSRSVIQRRRENPAMVQNSDTAIGGILNRLKLEMWFVDPSPVYHAATHSAIGHGGNNGNRNCGRCADHDKPLKEQVHADWTPDQSEKAYDRLYKRGGFRYGKKQASWFRREVIERYHIAGTVLDAPCGNGFFSKLLQSSGCTVTATDLSEAGVKAAGDTAVQWNLEQINPDWVGKFDWVVSRAISHLHRKEIDTPETAAVFRNLLSYCKPETGRLCVVYWTNQSDRDSTSGCHWNHPLKRITELLSRFGTVEKSEMRGQYAHVIVRP